MALNTPDRVRHFASALPDFRRGSTKRYAVAAFSFQSPSFLDFQRRMLKKAFRSNCHTLFGVDRVPSDNHIRNLLDGPVASLLNLLFPLCLDTLRDHGPLHTFLRLDGRLLVALDGIQIHCSDSIHCGQCSTRHVGKHKRKQGCECNAAKRWLDSNMPALRPYPPVVLGDDLYCCQLLCQRVLDSGADFLSVCKPNSHKTLYKKLPDRRIWSTGWIRTRIRKGRIEERRIRWRNNVQVRAGKDALRGNWIEIETRRNGECSYHNAFLTSLKLTAENVAEIARAGPARWKIEICEISRISIYTRNFLLSPRWWPSDGILPILRCLPPTILADF